jgi:hypothetical protein
MNIVERFEGLVAMSIEAAGIWPAPMLSEDDDGKLEVAALALPPEECFMQFCTKTLEPTVAASIFGLDRQTRPGQGTEFRDVLTCVLYERVGADVTEYRTRDQFRFGVINYQHRPRIIRPMDWENAFWNLHLRGELFHYIPALVIKRIVATGKSSSQGSVSRQTEKNEPS